MFIKRIIPYILAAILSTAYSADALSANKPIMQEQTYKPDFSYPKEVDSIAVKNLDKAVASRNWSTAIESLSQIALARNEISRSETGKSIALIDSIANLAPSPWKEAIITLECCVYSDVYRANQWEYNSRVLPEGEFPENISEWGALQFGEKILILAESVIPSLSELGKVSISEFSPILTPSQKDIEKNNFIPYQKYYPTAASFIACELEDCLASFINKSETIPFGDTALKPDLAQLCSNAIESIFRTTSTDLLAQNHKDAYVQAVLDYMKRIGFESQRRLVEDAYSKVKDEACAVRIALQSLTNISECIEMEDEDEDEDFVEDSKQEHFLQLKWIRIAEELVKRYPDYDFTPSLQSVLEDFNRPFVRTKVNEHCTTRQALECEYETRGDKDFYLLLVKVNKLGDVRVSDLSKCGKLIDSKAITPTQTECKKGRIDFGTQPEGRYVTVPSVNGKLSGIFSSVGASHYLDVVTVSNITILVSQTEIGNAKSRVYVVDSRTLQPIKGAKISASSRNGQKTKTFNCKTDSEGGFELPSGYWDVSASYLNGTAEEYISISQSRGVYDKPDYSIDVYTDLGIVRPGKEVRFVALMLSTQLRESKVFIPKGYSATLLDASGQQVAETNLEMSPDGRGSGTFTIPEGRLPGNWRIRVSALSAEGNKYSGTAQIVVSEYKVPTFFVEIDTPEAQPSIGEPLKLSGYAKTYSGMPVGGAEVVLKIKEITPFFLWRVSSVGSASYTTKSMTDESGRFEITLTTDGLKSTRFENSFFQAAADVTDTAGETHDSNQLLFSFESHIQLIADVKPIVSLSDVKPIRVEAKDAYGNAVERETSYVLKAANGDVLTKGELQTPFQITPDNLIPGKYTLILDAEKAQQREWEFTVYNPLSNTVPIETPLWVEPLQEDGDQSSVKLRFGSSYPDSWLFMQISDCSGLLSREWIKSNGEIQEKEIPQPAGNQRIFVEICGMHDFELKSETITILPQAQKDEYTLRTKSFRDKVAPGQKESWSFQFCKNGDPIPSLAIATISDKGLNALTPFNWRKPGSYVSYPSAMRLRCYNSETMSDYFSLSKPNKIRCKYLEYPAFNWYGLSFGRGYSRYYSKYRSIKQSAMDLSCDGMLMEECEVPMMLNSAMTGNLELAKGAAKAEAAVEDAEAVMNEGPQSEKNKQEFRIGNIPVALFEPLLKSDDNGNIELSFEVPDYNSTWALQILGYDPTVNSALLQLDCTASKPIMVRPNVPRFLRSGDKTVIAATVFNNSDSTIRYSGRITLLDALSNRSLGDYDFSGSIAGNGSATMEAEISVPEDIQGLEITVQATDGAHSDGERNIIPVLESCDPVIESIPFWLTESQNESAVKLPKFNERDKVWLSYCDNPMWMCIASLPDLTSSKGSDIFSRMSALYGYRIACGITEKFPAVAETINKWFIDNDSILISPLAKNGELKIAELPATPWVNSAQTETLRMLHLDRLVNKSISESEYNKRVKGLLDMQDNDGGFKWCAGLESSVYSTTVPLLYFGMLRQLGYYESSTELDKALAKAIAYCDGKIYKNYIDNKKYFNPVSLLDWLYIRSFYPRAATDRKHDELYKLSIKAISENWKTFSIYNAATAAILLNRSGYKETALEIMRSLERKASVSDSKGAWYDNLISYGSAHDKLVASAQVIEAAQTCGYDIEFIHKLRQWLILQRQAQDWGKDATLAEVVNAIITSGISWDTAGEPTQIRIGGKTIYTAESPTGEITVELNAKEISKKTLEITKHGKHPSWGAVMSQRRLKPKEVKQYATEELKVEKRLFLLEGGRVTEIKNHDIVPGQKIRVQLTVTSDKDAEYIVITDNRSACLEPVQQLSSVAVKDGILAYQSVEDTSTSFYITYLAKGVYQFHYDCYADRQGDYAVGIATIQSLYSPGFTAHSAGNEIIIRR